MTKRDISKYVAKQNKKSQQTKFLEKLKELQDKEK